MSYIHLTIEKRSQIEVLRKEGYSVRRIVSLIGVHHSTVARELIKCYTNTINVCIYIFGGVIMCKIDPYHQRECDRQGCESWDEYCNLNSLNYSDIILDEDEDEDDDED